MRGYKASPAFSPSLNKSNTNNLFSFNSKSIEIRREIIIFLFKKINKLNLNII